MTSEHMEDSSSTVASITNVLRVAPEGNESSYFLQSILNYVWNGIYIESEDFSGEMYKNLLNTMAENADHFVIREDKLKLLKIFIDSFLHRAYDAEILFENAFWLEKTTNFLVDLQTYPSLAWFASFLASTFIGSFYKLYCILQDESDLGQSNENLASLRDVWLVYMGIIQHAIRCKQRNAYFTKELMNIMRIVSQCDLIFHDMEFYFDFYLECLQSENSSINKSALKSLQHLSENDSISESHKESLLEFMVGDRCATVLYVLATEKTAATVERTLELLLVLFKRNQQISCWDSGQYCTVFLNMFKESKNLRNLSGKLMLCSLENMPDFQKVTVIFEFYMQYMDDPGQMSTLIDALWSYDYMKDLKNLIQFFRTPTDECDTNKIITNSALAHFCVALLKRLLQPEFYEEDKILQFIKYTPRILAKLHDSEDIYHIYIGIFFVPEMVKLSHDLSATNPRYPSELFKELYFVLLTAQSYYLAKDITSIFIDFMEIGNNEAKQIIKHIAECDFNKFLTIKSESLTLDSLDFDLNLVLNRLNVILDCESVLSDEQNDIVYDLTNDGIFVKKLFDNVEDRHSTTEIFYIAAFSKSLIRKFIKAFKMYDFEAGHLQELKNKVLSLTTCLKEILKRQVSSLMCGELAIGTTINMISILQPSFLLSKQQEIHMLAVPPDTEALHLIMERSISILCCEVEGSKNYKQLILEHLKLFYKVYSGFPASVIDAKYLSQLLLKCPLVDGVNDLLLAVAQYCTPFERKYNRLCSLLAAIIIKWGDEKTDANVVINRLISIFKVDFEDWLELFTSIVLQTIAKLHQRIGAIPPDRNRILPLNLLKHFVKAGVSVNEIYEALNRFIGELRNDEKEIWKNFQAFLVKGRRVPI